MSEPLRPTPDELPLRLNPNKNDIHRWAYDPDAELPMQQDWEIVVWTTVDPALLVEFATDPACPKREFFLRCLYGRVGDEIRGLGRPSRLDHETWPAVESALESDDADVARWAQRALALRDRPELFEYSDWCDGGLANRADPWP